MQENILIFVCGGATAGLLIWLVQRFFYGVKGVPVPDSLDCQSRTVNGHIQPDTSDTPIKFYAFIYQDETTSPPASPDPSWLVSHTILPAVGVYFELDDVPFDVLDDMVRVAIWAEYEDGTVRGPGHDSFECNGSGSGSGGTVGGGGGGGLSVPMFRIAPRQYQLSFGQLTGSDEQWIQDLGGSGPLRLTYDGDTSGESMSQWVHQHQGECRCQLRIEKRGDAPPEAALIVTTAPNGSAAKTLVWKNEYWDFTGMNLLVAGQYSPQCAFPQTVTVSPG